jgi:hypothetical protein
MSSSLSNSLSATSGSGAGPAVVTYTRDIALGPDTATFTVTAHNATCTATDTKVVVVSSPPPVISNVSVMSNPVIFGGLAAIDFTTSNTTSWTISSAIGNGFSSDPPHSGTGDGDHFVIYSAASNDGQETMTITATGPGGQTTQTLSFLVSDTAPNTPPTISSVVATNTASGLTLSYTLSGANYWVLDPPRCSPGSGRGSGTFTAQCSATRFSEQLYTVYGIGSSGFGGASVLTVYITAPSSAAANTSFTASMGPNHSAYNWSVTNGTILSGQGTQTATIRAGTAGTPLTIQGTASSGTCCTAIDTVSVSITQPPPSASVLTISKDPVPAGGSATINAAIADTTSWSLTSALGNTISPHTGTGSGSFSAIYSADTNLGSDTITLTLTGPGGVRSFVLHPVVN